MKTIGLIRMMLPLAALLAGCGKHEQRNTSEATVANVQDPEPRRNENASATSSPIVAAARSQIGRTTMYDPAYVRLEYPGGDVPIERGVCTDVVVRALRDALGMDLQKLLHDDMTASFSQYPALWGLKKPDKNIDHRRVPNLMTFFDRKGYSVPISKNPEDYLPGDIVTCIVGRNLPHVMIVSDRMTAAGEPMVIHNIGSGAQEENRLFSFPITGHYRINRQDTPGASQMQPIL